MGGVLKSWAVPKGPPLEPGIKRLAMQVDDHTLEYGSFEGTIPAGHYGAGRVEIWDKGEYVLVEKSPDTLRFTLDGTRLQGTYSLVLMNGSKKQWLLFKRSSGTEQKSQKDKEPPTPARL